MTAIKTKNSPIAASAASSALLAALILILPGCAGKPPILPEEPSSLPPPPMLFQAGHSDPIAALSPLGGLGGESFLLSSSASSADPLAPGTIKLWHTDGRLQRSFEASPLFTPLSDRNRFAWIPIDRRSINTSHLQDPPGTPPRPIFKNAEQLETLAAGPRGLLLAGPEDRETGTLILIDDRTGRVKARIGREGGLSPLSEPLFSPDGSMLLISSRGTLPEDKGRNPLLLYHLSVNNSDPADTVEPTALYPRFKRENDTVAAVRFLTPDTLLLLGTRGNAAAFRLTAGGNLESLWEIDKTGIRSVALEPGGSLLALSLEAGGGSIAIYRFSGNTPSSRLEKPRLHRTIRQAAGPLLFPEEGGYLYSGDRSGRLSVYDTEEGRRLFSFPGPADPILGAEIIGEEERIHVLRPDRVDVLDYAGILQERLPPREPGARGSMSAEEQGDGFLLLDSTAALSVEASPEAILRIRRSGGAGVSTAARGGEWISWDGQGNFAGSRGAGELLGVADAGKLHYIGQAAAHFNAPDRLLEEMQAGTPEETTLYRKVLRDRTRNISLQELQPPRVEIRAAATRRITDMKEAMSISFDISPGAYPVKSYQIRVNGAPLYPWPGKPVTAMHIEEEIVLYETLNRVEVSCMDSREVHSNSPFRYGYVKKAKAGDAYYVGFGISDYDDDSLDLAYAAKDASDLLIYFENVVFERSFAVTHKAYTDREVSPEAFAEANSFLRDATGDDTVVIFVAGRVLHAENETEAGFYLLPSAADLSDIPSTSIPLAEIERIFDGIPARRRLLLLDTGRTPLSADRDRAIYLDPGRSSGAIIYTSTDGSGQSLESGELKNGLFAEALLQVLVDKRSDQNRNNYIDLQELTGAVTRRVVELSGDRQHPSLLRDNPLSPLFLPMVTDFGVDIGSLLRASDASAGSAAESSSW